MFGELQEQRLTAVVAVLRQHAAQRVIDLGCGSGTLLSMLSDDPQFTELVGVEQSPEALAVARRTLTAGQRLDAAQRVRLLAANYQDLDPSMQHFDAALMIETIEHNPPQQLDQVAQAVFQRLAPHMVIMTTPNGAYNPCYGLAPGEFRDPDHYFEWDTARFRKWCRQVAQRFGYQARFRDIGDADPEYGAPTQMAVFRRD